MSPRILTLQSFPIVNVKLERYNEIIATPEYGGELVTGWNAPVIRGAHARKPERPKPPKDKFYIEKGNVPYLIILRKTVDAGPDGPCRNATCSLLLVGAATYDPCAFSPRQPPMFDQVIRTRIRVLRTDLPLDFKIRADELPCIATAPGLDIGQILTRQFSAPAP